MESSTQYSKCKGVDAIYKSFLQSFDEIAKVLRYSTTGSDSVGQQNAFGDNQIQSDVKSDDIIFENLKKCGACSYGMSEERPEPQDMGGKAEKNYIVTFDPLDGSSIMAVNWTVGTIFAIWEYDNTKGLSSFMGCSGRKIVGAGLSCYGPRTNCIFFNDQTNKVEEHTLTSIKDKETWVKTKENLVIKEKGNIFAPGNLRATNENEGYKKLVDHWISNRYTLRYTGGMAPDVYQLFIKGQGVYTTVVTKTSPAKLRLLYEVAPLAYLVEKAGGKSSIQEKDSSILDIVIEGYDQRCGIMVGSKDEIDKALSFLKDN